MGSNHMRLSGNWVGLLACVASCLATDRADAQEPVPAPADSAPADRAPASAPEAPPVQPSIPPAPPETAIATGAPTANQDDTAGEPGDRKGEARFHDANADHVVLFSTAETHPKGTFYFSDYELILLQAGYAITDSVQLSFTGVPPLVKNQPYFFDLAVKGNLLRTDAVRLALIGAGTVVVAPKADPNSLLGARVNGVSQFCFESLCRSSFSLNVGTFINSESNKIIPITLGGGLVVHASELVKLLFEPAYALAVGDGVENQPEGFLLNYGIRLSGERFGFDLAFIRPFGGESPFILGVPWVAFTYRTSGDTR